MKYILVILILILPFTLPGQGPYYVAPWGSDTNTGGLLDPFQTIQTAVNKLMSGVSSPTCYIYPGIYTQSIEINSNNNTNYLVITALSNNAPPVLDGNFSSSPLMQYGINVSNTSKVKIDSVIVRRFLKGGILFNDNTTDCLLLNSIVDYCSNKGIIIKGKNIQIISNIIKNITGGASPNGITIYKEDNIIKGNEIFSNGNCGIETIGMASNDIIISNKIYNNYDGIKISGHGHSILWNEIYKNDQDGIIIPGSENQIKYNSIFSNNRYGITITYNVTENLIINNDFYGTNQLCGVYIHQSDNNTVSSNTFRNLRGDTNASVSFSNRLFGAGVTIKNGANGNIIADCTFFSNGFPTSSYAIFITNATNNFIRKNFITNNRSGIRLDTGAYSNEINENTIIKVYDGIFLSDGDANIIRGNLIDAQSGCSIYLEANAANTLIYNNDIKLSTTNVGGIRINSGYNTLISNNIINGYYGNQNSYGVKFEAGAQGCRVVYNSFINLGTGILDEQGYTYTVNNNYIYGCQTGGKVLFSSVSNRWFLNTFESNNIGFSNKSFLSKIYYNNFINNFSYDFYTSTSIELTNNFWGADYSASNIYYGGKVIGISSISNIIPYRVENPFDITPGADIIPPPVPVIEKARQENKTIVLRWYRIPGVSGYNVYKKSKGDVTELHPLSDKIAVLTNEYHTNFIDYSPYTNYTNFYWITAIDDYTNYNYQNISWFSLKKSAVFRTNVPYLEVRDLVFYTNRFSNQSQVTVIILNDTGYDRWLIRTNETEPTTNTSEGWTNQRYTYFYLPSSKTNNYVKLYLWCMNSSTAEISPPATWTIYYDTAGPDISGSPSVLPISDTEIVVSMPSIPPDNNGDGIGSYYWIIKQTVPFMGTTNFYTNTIEVTTYTLDNLIPNKAYGFSVLFMDKYKQYNPVNWTEIQTNYTFAKPPYIESQRQPGNFYTNKVFIFTNKATYGENGISYYYYKWDKNSFSDVTSFDIYWDIQSVSIITCYATNYGEWYLHIKSYNFANEGHYQVDIGPFYYYRSYPAPPIILYSDKNEIIPDGKDRVRIRSELITNIFAPTPVEDGTEFEVMTSFPCVIEDNNGGSNNIVFTKDGYLDFYVSTKGEGMLEITVYSIVNNEAMGSISIISRPEMELNKPGMLIYNNIIFPGKGDKLKIYFLNSKIEPVKIKIYDEFGNEIKDFGTLYNSFGYIEWDLKLNNKILPSATYFVVGESPEWKVVKRFVVIK